VPLTLGLLYVAQPKANALLHSAGGRDKALALKAKDEVSGIASQAQSQAADAQAKGKETAEKVKSKLS
jgi:hypothetical protein